jgi:hypothetical protein
VSIDDIVSEQQMTYVARTLIGWRPVIDQKINNAFENSGANGANTG